TLGGNPSNKIVVLNNGFGNSDNLDGIHFNKNIGSNANIKIDGNRIGYNNGLGSQEVIGDGIEFRGTVSGNANIDVTDNWINSDKDGIRFSNNVSGSADILIGGSGDKNTIEADGDGIQFAGNITGSALVAITYNDIEAGENGVEFNGDTSNSRNNHDEEILIAYNDIDGGINGILFEGRASNWRHDIVIRNNTISGSDWNGITHTGGIDDAELYILDNDSIYGEEHGIEITGFFFNDARIQID